MPSSFLAKRTVSKSVPLRVFTYDREIVCFPKTFLGISGLVKIPRRPIVREFLVINNLIGNIRLQSDMSEEMIMAEIRSVFKFPMNDDAFFDFKILQPSGGNSKSLSIRQVSSSYRWTASTIAGKNAKCPIYILAREDLRLVKKTIIAGEEEVSEEEVDSTPAKQDISGIQESMQVVFQYMHYFSAELPKTKSCVRVKGNGNGKGIMRLSG